MGKLRLWRDRHFGDKIGGIGITVVNYHFYTMGLVITIDFFVGRQDEFIKHFRRHE
ncbi:MAG: hypothetical protein LBD55_06060 [Treponema sp.]|nr:hypothetical protein [Treponema sp.]